MVQTPHAPLKQKIPSYFERGCLKNSIPDDSYYGFENQLITAKKLFNSGGSKYNQFFNKIKDIRNEVCFYIKQHHGPHADFITMINHIDRILKFYKIPFDACSAAAQVQNKFGRRRYSLKEVDAMYDRYVSMYRKKYRSKKV